MKWFYSITLKSKIFFIKKINLYNLKSKEPTAPRTFITLAYIKYDILKNILIIEVFTKKIPLGLLYIFAYI